MRLFLHICCANCALYPVSKLRDAGMEMKGFWYNPNIHPAQEYLNRLAALNSLQELWGLDIAYADNYGLKDFLRAVGEKTEPGERCRICYRMRLEETAGAAKRLKADAFSTTLLVSPYQKFDILLEEAGEVESLYKIPFYYEDFRPGYREGVRMSKELGLYRQKYCGCIYSEMERFLGPKHAGKGKP